MKFLRTPLLLLVLVAGATAVHAKSVSYQQDFGSQPFYYYHHTDSPMVGLRNVLATVSYSALFTNADTGATISDNASVPIGSRVKITPKAYESNDIYWFGVGASSDSPYGDWGEGPSGFTPTCFAKDYVSSVAWRDDTNFQCQGARVIRDPGDPQSQFRCDYTFDIHAPLYMSLPATREITTSNNLSCDPEAGDGSKTCTVVAAGPASASVSFGATRGRFFYRFAISEDQVGGSWPPGCYGNFQPMGGPVYTGTPTYFEVPTQTISFPFTAFGNNQPPSQPTLSCPTGGNIGQPISFSVDGTDPDGDQIRYGIDWTSDNSVTQWVPAAGYVSSGTSQSFTRTWSTAGTYTVRALTEDAAGANSAFSESCSVTIESPSPDLTAGSITPTTATAGTPVTLSATASNIGQGASGSFPMLFEIETPSTLKNSSYLSGLGAGASAPGSVSHTFDSAGTYSVRACANFNTSWTAITTESNYDNNCGPWTAITVTNPAPTGTLSCSVSPTNPVYGSTVTYTVTPSNGATGPYVWDDQQGGSYGSGASVSRLIPGAGPYVMNVDGTNAVSPASCPVVGGQCANPSATISATPDRVREGETTSISWSATGVDTSCTISGTDGYSNTVPGASCTIPPGGPVVRTITTQTVYTISCDGGDQKAQVVVNVIPRFIEF